MDATLEAGAPDADVATAREAATLLLGLPWELLHDSDGFLFQGAKPTRVRRRLPNTRVLDVPVVATPIRILLVTARPEDDACGYIDHRASALPLVEAMEALGGLVHLHVLNPPTLPEVSKELKRAYDSKTPYHVVHFDGHGVYDRTVGLGGLCFEDPQDIGRLDQRRHATVFTSDLGPLLRAHRIPLVFLEACQTAQAEKASESVASELLKIGVASVVAMSHSVLVETARRFVKAFYDALAGGARVGDAMLEGQRKLKDDTFRGRIFGAGELRLEDWFVPVLFQEKDDPQLFRATPAKQTQEDLQTRLKNRLGELPKEPETGFIGRSRELLALQRLLRHERYAVVRGQGGEGKTALAAELARWMVRSHQIRRAAFVSVETHSNVKAVLDAIGHQLVPNYSAATFDDSEKAILPVERALAEQSTLLVVDNMESILLPPFMAEETPDALSEEARRELDAILKLCARLNAKGDTRLVFTSRGSLPAPFDAPRYLRELHQLDREDAVKLVERVLNREADGAGAAADAAREAIEQLVEAVHGHARTLALLAPALRNRGVEPTRSSLVELMAEMERKFPGSREQSVFASVELSLRRVSPANRDKARVLGVFRGAFQLNVLRMMMEWEEADVASLAGELIETGLGSPNRYNHLTLNPALCPYLRRQMDPAEREALTARWIKAMRAYAWFLEQKYGQNTELAVTLTLLDLPNLFALLEQVQRAGDAEATIGLTTSLFTLLQMAGKPRLLELVAQGRDAAAATAGETWNHARFEAQRTRIEQQLAGGRMREAFDGAQALVQRARTAGKQAYPDADYDLAGACSLLARVLITRLDEPETVAVIWHQTGIAYQKAGQMEAAEDAYRKSLAIEVRLGNVAGKQAGTLLQLGSVYETLGRYEDAVAFSRQSADKCVELRDVSHEGLARSILGNTLRKLRRLDEARKEIRRAIECKAQFGHASESWTTWDILADIETDAGNHTGAAEAKRKAIECYLAYRRDGGENHTDPGRLCLAVTQPLLAGDPFAAASLLQQLTADANLRAWLHTFIQALQAIVTGSRDRTLADAPDLHYTMAAEILFLLDKLEKAGK